MKSISPNSPLLSLIVKPQGDVTTKDILARFHPIMKSLGYGNFQMEEHGFYIASKGGESLFKAERFVFAEVNGEAVVVNIDGHSIFGLKGVEEQLKQIQTEYENSIGCTTEILGPNYMSSLIGNLLYTALPIYLSAAVCLWIMIEIGLPKSNLINVFLYTTLGIIGAKTRFWVEQRRKQRPVWLSVLILLIGAPIAIGIVVLFFWAIDKLA